MVDDITPPAEEVQSKQAHDDQPKGSRSDEESTAGPVDPPSEGEPSPSGGAAPLDRADSTEAEESITAGSLRVDPQVARELYGALYTGVRSYGPAMFGDHNVQIVVGREKELAPDIGHLGYVAELLEVYATTGSDKRLVELLSQRAIACLIGPKNSGRFSSACAALAHVYGKDRIFEITLPAGGSPDTLFRDRGRIAEDSGFVLRYDRGDYAEVMRRLTDLFRRRGSGLLLVRDERVSGGTRHGAEVDHEAPEPIEVFRKHLAQRLTVVDPTASHREIAAYLDSNPLLDALGKTYGPKECVAIAYAVAEARPNEDAGMASALDRSQPRRRELAAEILIPPTGGSSTGGRRASQHERAFRISYAVFQRQPLRYVFEAAEWLLAEIDSAALRPKWGSMALQRSVDELLGEPLSKEWRAGRDAGSVTLGTSRLAWMRDPGLRGAILDVAWHEFDGTRKPLLRWLHKLVEEGDEVMSRAAAETAGLLAHYDFEYVHHELIDSWARSPRRQMREAAARTETTAEMAGDVGYLIREQLRAWCSSGTNYQRDTAALVYASGMRQPVLAWSMRDLGLIADNRMQWRSDAVAEAVNQLYQPEAAGPLVQVLAEWTKRTHARVHAARALIALARRPSPDVADPKPELLARLAAGDVAPAHLSRLWRVAFGDAALARTAASLLADWVLLADGDRSLRVHVEELLSMIAPGPGMRRRVAFYLEKQPEFRDGLPHWVREEKGPES